MDRYVRREGEKAGMRGIVMGREDRAGDVVDERGMK